MKKIYSFSLKDQTIEIISNFSKIYGMSKSETIDFVIENYFNSLSSWLIERMNELVKIREEILGDKQ